MTLHRSGPVRFLRRWHGRYNADGLGPLASALAYHGFLSLFPLMLLALSVLGFVLNARPDLAQEWAARLSSSVPGLGEVLSRNLAVVADARAAAGIIGFAGLLWSGTGVVRVASHALGVVHRVPPAGGLWLHAWAIGSLLSLGVLVLASSAATAAATVTPLPGIGIAVGALLDVVVFLAAFTILTRARAGRARDFLPGALFAAAGWTLLKLVGAWYAQRTVAGAEAVYGAFAAAVGALIILSGQARLFLYGAALNAVLRQPVLKEVRSTRRGETRTRMTTKFGLPAARLDDGALERELRRLYDTRAETFFNGSAQALRTHTDRMLELEHEYAARFPDRTRPSLRRMRPGPRARTAQPARRRSG